MNYLGKNKESANYDIHNYKIYDNLMRYANEDYVPMHMPGHKRNLKLCSDMYAVDITEIDGFDNLHNPTGIIKESMDNAARFYHAQKTYYLVNGSSCGNMAAISASALGKTDIIIARNSHKSVYNAIYINRLNAQYIYPDVINNYGINEQINPQSIEKLLQEYKDNNRIEKLSSVVITSPTYEGVVMDIKNISNICHYYGIPLIVDEAHGAHFRYNEEFPISALDMGADIVIQSVHKTLPSLTQTALLHIGYNSLISEKDIEKYLDIYQSTSPSYLFMSSIENSLRWSQSAQGEKAYDNYVKMLYTLRTKLKTIPGLMLYEYESKGMTNRSYDISKLVIGFVKNDDKARYLKGQVLYDILLKKYKIQLEMYSEIYIIAMTSVADKEEFYDRFYYALNEISKDIIDDKLDDSNYKEESVYYINKEYHSVMSIYEADNKEKQIMTMPLDDSDITDRISSEMIVPYPPGIPIIVPGEVITKEVAKSIIEYMKDTNKPEISVISGVKK